MGGEGGGGDDCGSEVRGGGRKLAYPQHDILRITHPNPLPSAPRCSPLSRPQIPPPSFASKTLLSVLARSVRRRVLTSPPPPPGSAPDGLPHASVGVLFSGGIDCAVVAKLAGECTEGTVDLITVAFGMDSMDRIAACRGYEELDKGNRGKFRLIVVDGEESLVNGGTIRELVKPQGTNMDYNIGMAMWNAAGGRGGVYVANGNGNGEGGEVRNARGGWVTKEGMGGR